MDTGGFRHLSILGHENLGISEFGDLGLWNFKHQKIRNFGILGIRRFIDVGI